MVRAPEIVVGIQCLIVAASGIFALRAYHRGLHDWRPFHLAVAMLSGMYLVGYLWLIIGHVDRKTWSEVMVGVGFVTWPVVWLYPSILSMRANRAVSRLRSKVAEYDSPDTIVSGPVRAEDDEAT